MSETPLFRPAAGLPRRLSFLGLVALAGAAGFACYTAPTPSDGWPTTEASPSEPGETGETDGPGGAGGSAGTAASNASGAEASGLPCDVDALLRAKCQKCHGPTSNLAPLVTYEDLVAPSDDAPGKSVAARSLELMKSNAMPPAKSKSRATPDELAALERWVDQGLPAGTCAKAVPDGGTGTGSGAGAGPLPPPDGGLGPPPADAGPQTVCTSGLTWTSLEASARMNPGKACIGCHTNLGGAPILQIGGTVYPTRREPDGCHGVQVPAYVVVKDATGRTVTLSTGATGNFTLSTKVAALTYPISVKVVRNGKERVMVGSPPHGDCNACHGASRRIVAP